MSVKLHVTAEIIVPRVPNFLLFADGLGKISIADVTDDSLRGLAEEWTTALLARAAELRKNPAALDTSLELVEVGG